MSLSTSLFAGDTGAGAGAVRVNVMSEAAARRVLPSDFGHGTNTAEGDVVTIVRPDVLGLLSTCELDAHSSNYPPNSVITYHAIATPPRLLLHSVVYPTTRNDVCAAAHR